MAKEYIVVKNGTELKPYKTLPAAKTLADKEGADVFCEGECVYHGTLPDSTGSVEPVEPVTAVEEEQPPVEPVKTRDKYTLTRKMNVREAPSLHADKLKILDRGAVVEVLGVRDDWLCLADGGFILYEDGKNAVHE